LHFFQIVPKSALVFADSLGLAVCHFGVLSSEGVPKLEGEHCDLISLPDVFDRELDDAGQVVAELVIAIFSKLVHDLVHSLRLSVHHHAHVLEGLMEVLLIL